MLALALGVVVTAGIVTLFVGNNQTYTLLNGQSRMQENARFAVDFMAAARRVPPAISVATRSRQRSIKTLLNGAWNQTFRVRHHDADSGVYTASTAGNNRSTTGRRALTTLPRLGSAVGCTSLPERRRHYEAAASKSDILVLRHVQVPGRVSAAIVQIGRLTPTVEVPEDRHSEFAAGNFVAINNCEQATVFRVANINVAGAHRDALETSRPAVGPALYQNAPRCERCRRRAMPYGEANNAAGAERRSRADRHLLTSRKAPAPTTAIKPRGRCGARPAKTRRSSLIEGIEGLRASGSASTRLPADTVITSANRYVTF